MTQSTNPLATIARLESNVRGYVRSFPTVFARAEGASLFDREGRRYVDFFAGAGALNYGHNPAPLREALSAYLLEGGVAHGLDMATEAKIRFIETFEARVLAPRDLSYKLQFTGPTGTNAVEAALKIARKVTGRSRVASFTNGYHGMTLGALACTGNLSARRGAGASLPNTLRLPFDGYHGDEIDTLELIEGYLTDGSSGMEKPAAFILETIQAEGGVLTASDEWLRGLQRLARAHGILLIVDDIQVGCGRTGPFFSFEEAGLTPDIVCLSKSLSGFGLPFALVLLLPDLDVWQPGEHNGTFRGNNHAFVTASAALDTYWKDDTLSREVVDKSQWIHERLTHIATMSGGEHRGRGLIQGIAWDPESGIAADVSRQAFAQGLIIETAGPEGEVLKLLPPLTIDAQDLAFGLEVIERSVGRALASRRRAGGDAMVQIAMDEVKA